MSCKTARGLRACAAALALLAVAACQSDLRDFSQPPESAAKLAAIRSRVFATDDKRKTLRAAIAALQQLGFVVDRADFAAASVSAAKADQYLLRLTVTVAPASAGRLLVRAVARYDVTPVLDAEPYQKFFATLAHILELEAHPVE
jgi:hypothetical protein